MLVVSSRPRSSCVSHVLAPGLVTPCVRAHRRVAFGGPRVRASPSLSSRDLKTQLSSVIDTARGTRRRHQLPHAVGPNCSPDDDGAFDPDRTRRSAGSATPASIVPDETGVDGGAPERLPYDCATGAWVGRLVRGWTEISGRATTVRLTAVAEEHGDRTRQTSGSTKTCSFARRGTFARPSVSSVTISRRASNWRSSEMSFLSNPSSRARSRTESADPSRR